MHVTRLGIQHSPPVIMVEYVTELPAAKSRYLHKIQLNTCITEFTTKEVINVLREDKSHGRYLKAVSSQQLGNLIRRVKENQPGTQQRRGRSAPVDAGSSSKRRKPDQFSWPADAWATFSRSSTDTSSSIGSSDGAMDVADAFEAFRKANSVEETAMCFARLWNLSTQGKCQMDKSKFPLDDIKSGVGDQRRLAKLLWDKLNAKICTVDYKGQPCAGLRTVVVGAGPVGLRLALELRLLGCDVIVVEKRIGFDRINRLHLWQWVSKDLQSWGAKIFEPPELAFGADPDFLHIGIHELQLLLLKPCLLLGVQVFFGTEFKSVREAHGAKGVSWEVDLSLLESAPGPRPPEALVDVSVLVGCDAAAGSVAKVGQIPAQDVGFLRRGAAIGLVINYVNSQTSAEKRRRPFSLARQFYEQLFVNCQESSGMDLENIVYYKSTNTHYFVMTPTKKCLQDLGILSQQSTEGDILKNVNQEALERAAQRVTSFPWVGSECLALPPETPLIGSPQLFDFSQMKRAARGLHFLDPEVKTQETSKLLCGVCGDALIEPFWPEGLGVTRGFFSALDMAWSIKTWALTSNDLAAETAFENAYTQLKSLAAKTKDSVLRSDDGFALDPSTRYRYLGVSGGGGGSSRSKSMPPTRARTEVGRSHTHLGVSLQRH
eukprot:gnl/MRDRNA2_/MRDRNA2_84512_c0_seq5.p1 gnl/MRDRNA2_/MRDRNA2_84512_c0~~gnl/MRDRNA2_/MRDRNA2_84512_c0_seq5.p1  ORF type:complete len:689 (+),score=122.86 gnl/MRDRNA2_/MRDRNA2_84512_c0_seq5:89-2068(+)